MKAIDKFGLVKRPTYEELADYITRDPDKIKTPDRTWSYLRDSHMLSWLQDIKNFESRQDEADEDTWLDKMDVRHLPTTNRAADAEQAGECSRDRQGSSLSHPDQGVTIQQHRPR